MLVVSLATATQRQTCSTNGTHKLPVQLSLATAPGFGAAAPATAAGNGESRPLGLCRDQPLPEPAPVPPAASVGFVPCTMDKTFTGFKRRSNVPSRSCPQLLTPLAQASPLSAKKGKLLRSDGSRRPRPWQVLRYCRPLAFEHCWRRQLLDAQFIPS